MIGKNDNIEFGWDNNENSFVDPYLINDDFEGEDFVDFSELGISDEEYYNFSEEVGNIGGSIKELKKLQEDAEVINGVNSYDKTMYFDDVYKLFIEDPIYNNIVDLNNFNYGEYLEEYYMEDINGNFYRVYSIELFNDLNDLNRYMVQLIVNDKFLEDNKMNIEFFLKGYLLNVCNITVNEVFPFSKYNKKLSELITPVKVKLSMFLNLYQQCQTDGDTITNKFQVNLFNFFNEVRNLDTKKETINDSLNRLIEYRYLNTMHNGIDIKVPIRYEKTVTVENEDVIRHVWDYDYALSPMQNLDQNNKLKINMRLLGKNFDNYKFDGNPNVFSNFTLSKYEILHQKYWIITTFLRPLINILREKYSNIYIDNDIFEITQLNRIQEDSRLTHTLIKYESTFTELETFPNIVSLLNCNVSDLNKEQLETIKNYIMKTKNQLEILDKESENGIVGNNSKEVLFRIYINLISIYNYILYLDFNEKELIKELNRIEAIREGIRHRIMYYNLCMRGNIIDLIDLIGSAESCYQKEIFKYKYSFEGFNFNEKDGSPVYNDVVLTIKDNPKASESDDFADYIKSIEEKFINID